MAPLRVSLALCALQVAVVRALPAQNPGFRLVEVAKGVYAAIRSDSSANVVHGNAVIIVNDSDVVVVDANGTPAAARRTIAAIRRLTRNPVRYLVNTHWHDDHVMGNQAYRDAFPGVEIVAHPHTREDMTTDAVKNREQYVKALPGIIEFVREQTAAGRGLDGQPATPAELRTLAADVRLADEYLAQAPSFRVTLPTLTVEHRLTLHRGARIIELRHFGRGNTRGDLIVHLPNERVLITGDLVVWPTPFFFGSYIGEWIGALDSLRALQAEILIPGHGPVMRDYGYVELVSTALCTVRDRTAAAVARGLTLEQARDSLDFEELRRRFAGDDRVKNQTWRNYFVVPAVAGGFAEATAQAKPQ